MGKVTHSVLEFENNKDNPYLRENLTVDLEKIFEEVGKGIIIFDPLVLSVIWW